MTAPSCESCQNNCSEGCVSGCEPGAGYRVCGKATDQTYGISKRCQCQKEGHKAATNKAFSDYDRQSSSGQINSLSALFTAKRKYEAWLLKWLEV